MWSAMTSASLRSVKVHLLDQLPCELGVVDDPEHLDGNRFDRLPSSGHPLDDLGWRQVRMHSITVTDSIDTTAWLSVCSMQPIWLWAT